MVTFLFKGRRLLMAIKKEDYETIKSAIHMSIVPMCVKELWFKDKKFYKWFNDDRKRQISNSK